MAKKMALLTHQWVADEVEVTDITIYPASPHMANLICNACHKAVGRQGYAVIQKADKRNAYVCGDCVMVQDIKEYHG